MCRPLGFTHSTDTSLRANDSCMTHYSKGTRCSTGNSQSDFATTAEQQCTFHATSLGARQHRVYHVVLRVRHNVLDTASRTFSRCLSPKTPKSRSRWAFLPRPLGGGGLKRIS